MERKIYPDKKNLYRMPWSTNESPIGWVEVTDVCNIHCEGCYRLNRDGHKPFEQIRDEILFLKKWRNCDAITLAGGEAILHPEILDILRFIQENKMKSIIITNGVALTAKFLKELKDAGLTGVSFHIDSTQDRPEFKEKVGISELELNKLRLKYAKVVDEVGGLTSSFGITVDEQNCEEIPKFVQWAIDNIRIINALSFITLRGLPVGKGIEYYANHEKIELKEDSLGYSINSKNKDKIGVFAKDVYSVIKENFPEYEANSYLGGTVDHTSLKWIIGNIILNTKGKMFGAYGKKTMEIVQTMYHLIYNSYVTHIKKRRIGKKIFLLSVFDKTLRKTFKKFIIYVLQNPVRLFYPLNALSIVIIQPPDLLDDGTCDMCEGCPDMCVFDGKLVNSCRLDECIQYGALLHTHITNEKSMLVEVQ